MLVVDRKIFIFHVKDVYFSDDPFDMDGCDGVTFEYCKNNVDVKGFTRQKRRTLIIDLNQDLETIWQNMDRKSTRHSIAKAEKKEITIQMNNNFEQFFKIFKLTMKHKDFGSFLLKRKTTLDILKKYGTCFTVEYDNEVLGGHLYFEDNNNILLMYSASIRFDVDKNMISMIGNANRMLHWEVMKYAKEKGIKVYDWGGLWFEKEAEKDIMKKGINLFKLSFGGEIVARYRYVKNYSKMYNLFYRLYTLKKIF